MILKNNRAPLLSNIKLYASFHHHMWIQTGVTVRKRLIWIVTSVTLTFDLRPWPFAWTLPWSLVITPGNFMMIRWWEHSQKGVTDGQTDRRTENTIHRAAWSPLKIGWRDGRTDRRMGRNEIPAFYRISISTTSHATRMAFTSSRHHRCWRHHFRHHQSPHLQFALAISFLYHYYYHRPLSPYNV